MHCNQLKKTGADILEIDYLDEDTIKRAAVAYGGKPLDILVNVGGKSHLSKYVSKTTNSQDLRIKYSGLPPHSKPWHKQTTSSIIEKFSVMALVCLVYGLRLNINTGPFVVH